MRISFTVLSSSLKWVPIGNQTDIFQEANMQPLHDDILLAKMNSGHEINLEAYAVKGWFGQVAFQEYQDITIVISGIILSSH